MCPIRRLNDDVLLTIFILLAEQSRQAFHVVLAISHVCTRWRRLSLQRPELWRRYALMVQQDGTRTPDYTEEMLSRCGSTSLDVGWERILHDSAEVPLNTAVEELKHLPQIRSYRLQVNRCFHDLLEALQKSSVPNLKHLSIDGYGAPFCETAYVIPSSIFGGRLPALTSLEMNGCWMDIDGMELGNLRDLRCTLKYCQNIPREILASPDAWIKCLSRLPQLSRLHISTPDRVFFFSPPSSAPTLPATLPLIKPSVIFTHLTDLYLDVLFDDIQILLEHISLPACRKLEINILIPTFPQSEEFASRMRQILSRHAGPSSKGSRLCIQTKTLGALVRFVFYPNDHSPQQRNNSLGVDKVTDLGDMRITLRILIRGAFPAPSNMRRCLETWLPVVKDLTSLCIATSHLETPYEGPIYEFIQQATSLSTLVCPRESIEAVVGSTVRAIGDNQYVCPAKPHLEISAYREPRFPTF